jgi:hypothetical protein
MKFLTALPDILDVVAQKSKGRILENNPYRHTGDQVIQKDIANMHRRIVGKIGNGAHPLLRAIDK